MHKHSDAIFIAAQNQSFEFIIHKTTLLIDAALGFRLRKSEPPTLVSTIIRKMRSANEIGLAPQSFRNSAKRAGRIDTNTARGHGTAVLDLEWRLVDALPREN